MAQHLPLAMFTANDGKTRLQILMQEDSLWLTQKQITELFERSPPTINEHLKNIYEEGELEPDATIRKFRIVALEGASEVERLLDHYNLDAVLSVYWLPLPEVDSHAQGGLVLLPAYVDDTIQTRGLQANAPGFCLPSSPEQMGKSCTGLLLRGLRKESQKRNCKVISYQINMALLHHLYGSENDVWLRVPPTEH